MKNRLYSLFNLVFAVSLFPAVAQTVTGPGDNSGGPVSLESQTGSPVGQADFQTDLFTGRFGYSVPLEVAPARHDSQPNLELLYNSANGNSWCGVGWDLDLGYVERETKYGVPVLWSGGKPASPMQYDDSKGFLFSFKNKMSDLVAISTGVYRAQIQGDFMQYLYYSSSNTWVVIDKSGNEYIFGSSSASRMTNPKSGWSSTGDQGTFRWALDTIVMATGDKATVSYQSIGGRLYPQYYKYNGSVLNGGVTPLCQVQFNLTTANRADTTISCRAAYAVTNQFLLSSIVHTVNGMMVWSNALNYTASPSTGRAMLSSVTRYGTNLTSTLPPITFNYSQQSFTFQPGTTNWGNLYDPSSTKYNQAYYGFNNVVCDLVDIDGDGLPDRVLAPVPDSSPANTWLVQRNTGSGFATTNAWFISGQTNSTNYTINDASWAAINGSHGRLIDLNGAGWPEFVVDPLESYFNNGTNYSRLAVQVNQSTNLSAPQISWTNVISQLSTNQTSNYKAVENGAFVEMLDMNGDGLPDRVMVAPSAPFSNYFVQFNTGHGFTSPNSFGPFRAQGQTNGLTWGGLLGTAGNSGSGVSMRMLDINGDGLPDRVMLVYVSGQGPAGSAQTNLVVELNNGYGFEAPINWTNVDPRIVTCDGGPLPGISDLGDGTFVAYRDVNGDGLPDRILACWCAYTGYANWLVQINTGTGFANALNWPVSSQGQSNTNYCGIQTSTSSSQLSTPVGQTMLIDMNGDGLPDRVEYDATGPANFYYVELSSGPFPDLLTLASNGLGGFVSATYKPSTQYDNRQNTNASPTPNLLPFAMYTVSAVSVGDGVYPANTTTYGYSGGYWSPVLRQFNGFAQTTVADPLGLTSIHWFHQAGGRNNSAFGEFNDTTNTIGKEGMEFRTDTIGSNGQPYKLVLNQINETSNNYQHFAYVTTNIEIDYPASSGSYKATARGYGYNLGNGNPTGTTNWGQVLSVNTANESFSDTASDSVYQTTTFATITANTNIVDKPQTVTLSTDSAGQYILRQNTYSYDTTPAANLAAESNLLCMASGAPELRTTSYTYDNYDNEKTRTDPAGIATQITYESAFETYPSQTTVGGVLTTTTSYDARNGKLSQSTGPTGLVTANSYDPFLRLSEVQVSTTADGTPNDWLQKYTYGLGVASGAPQNFVYRQQSDGVDTTYGHQTYSYFDGLGRTIQLREEAETNGWYRSVDTVYDKRGNVQFTSLPYYNSGTNRSTNMTTELGTLRGYDPIGRQVQLTGAVQGSFTYGLLTGTTPETDSGSPVGSSSIAYYTNSDPWTWVVTDEAGTSHQYTLDAYGRTNKIVEAPGSLNYTTTLNWSLAGDLLGVTDNSNNVIQYSNNLLGEVVAMADPDMGVWQYERDYAGRIRHQIDGDGQRIDFFYTNDPLGRLVTREVYDLKGNYAYGVTNIYDSDDGDSGFPVYTGQLYKTIDSEGYTKYGYDIRGRQTITARYLSKNGDTYTTQYGYDDMDRVTSIVYPNGGPTIDNIYDEGANLSKVQPSGGSPVYYSATAFSPLDQIAGILYGNNLSSTYLYYANSKRLQALGTGTLQSLGYTYDAVADILSITDTASGHSGVSSAALANINYDGLHRLTSLQRNGTTYSFGYDSIGNMLTNTENGASPYVYSSSTVGLLPHAVKSANGLKYTYDLCGNMLSRGSQALVYNPENRLIASAVSNQITTFGYDAGGNRLWKQGMPSNSLQVWIGNIYEEKDGKKLYHISAGDRLVYTYASDNSVQEYYHPDHLHSANILSTTTGGVYQHYEYNAYGFGRYSSSTTAFPTTKRFTSQSFDEETGLYCYGARYYDPLIGRFVQPDDRIPNFVNPQAYDRYAYCYNNPLRYTDPNGRDPWEIYSHSYSEPQEVAISGTMAPIAAGMVVGAATAGVATPLLAAYAAPTFVAVGSGMIGGAAGDVASQAMQVAINGRGSISGNEVAASALVGGALNYGVNRVFSLGSSEPTAQPPMSGENAPPKVLNLNGNKYPVSAANLEEAGALNTPLTVNRTGAAANRAGALRGLPKIPGHDLDEAPPAMLRKPGDPVIVRPTPPADNRGAGASLGNQAKDVPEGGKVIIQIQRPAVDE